MKNKILAFILIACLLLVGVNGCGTAAQSGTTNIVTQTVAQTSTTTVTATATTVATVTTVVTPKSFIFTDSLGRKVEVPTNLTKVALSGPLAQIVLFAICPDKLVGTASKWDASAAQFLDAKYYNLPNLGQLYGGSGTLNLEQIAATGAQIVIDVGEVKANMATDLDTIQKQLGIPVVHIDGYTATMGNCYRMLGDLLGMKTEASVLAQYCDKVYADTQAISTKVGSSGKANLLYIVGATGLNVIAKGSYHAEIIDLLTNNLAIVSNPVSSGMGNAVTLEQIMLWNPSTIVFSSGSIYSTVGTNKDWATVSAIKSGQYYEAPYGPYNWMGFPPSVQRYLGMIWMAQLLYPNVAQYDVFTKVSEYFKLFYHSNITKAQYDLLVANSLGKK